VALLVSIDENDPRPLYEQLAAEVIDQVRTGQLVPGDELPSFRELADALGVNMHTVRHAYTRLAQEGVIVVRLGRRARVSARPRPAAPPERVDAVIEPVVRHLANEAWRLGLGSKDVVRRVEKAMRATRKEKSQ
jgi:GntR family transcriptional regulator